ncbi:uncharacterized protein BX663DRAFT_458336 [Cokeromyces recurvatus]|uniref:uncharacterized protein n=1 Tax=Cokeromyces recurvatus TaxID=90255 RepID=UPI00221E812F|nr:uncharacterized protein BX663DRAFT_458336 [Cokeromyces recurvatus]KAI7900634.1 hypothetical protein BX663DRAFT_458336 [Cokeromyces recurvatus]
MVDTTSSLVKRRKISQKTALSDKASRYPISLHFSALIYKQAPTSISISPQSILTCAPIPPNPTEFNVIDGDIFSLNGSIRKVHVKLLEDYHKQHTITHLKWNQKGNVLASADESGHLALWQIKSSIHDWELIYKVDIKQPLAAFLWLNSERQYSAQSKNTLSRDPIFGPRNPYGQLGFITVTVHGEITVHYQRNGSLFSSFSTPIPNIGRREISRADAGCFGMSLAGLDDWERISHADITLDRDGLIILAIHNASIQPKSISLHKIKIKFPKRSNEKGAIECRPTTTLKLQPHHNLLKDNHITQLVFKKNTLPVELVIGLGEKGDKYQSFISTWQLKKTKQVISNNTFGNITSERECLLYKSGTRIEGRYIAALQSSNTSKMIVGLSDGSIYIEKETSSLTNSIDDPNSYWKVVDSHKMSDGYVDPIVDLSLSPNETHIVYTFSSGNLGVSRIVDDTVIDVSEVSCKLKLCLLNNVDYLDLISVIIYLSKQEGYADKPEEILNDVLNMYEAYYYNCMNLNGNLESNQPLENWSLAHLEKAYSIAMAVYKRLPEREVQSINLSRAVQLPIILETFLNNCTLSYSDIMNILEKKSIDDDHVQLEFYANSLWTLASLSTWTLDYLKWILKEWNMLFNYKRPKNSKYNNISEKPVHAVLLLHQDSRIVLCKILKMIHHFIRYTTTATYQLEKSPESQPLLQKYTSTLLNNGIISLEEIIHFLNALEVIKPINTDTIIENRWSILLTSNLKKYKIEDIQKITNEYKDKCVKPSIYIDTQEPNTLDIVCKRMGIHCIM